MRKMGITLANKYEGKRQKSCSSTQYSEFSKSINTSKDHILRLQKTVGNQAVQRLLKSGIIQAKLRIGRPNDIYEREADRVADEVMRMPEPHVQHPVEEGEFTQTKPPSEPIKSLIQKQFEDEDEETIQTRIINNNQMPLKSEEPKEESALQAKAYIGNTPGVTTDIEYRINNLRGGGQALPISFRAYIEPRFSYDFSHVRVHSDGQAAELAQSLNARAFTLGRDIVFGAEQYSPDTSDGKVLLTHELTHVVQQAESKAFKNSFHMQRQRQCWEREGWRACVPSEPPLILDVGAEEASKDFTRANTYIIEFYHAHDRIHGALARGSHRAITSFASLIGIPTSDVDENLALLSIGIVLSLMPGAAVVQKVFDKVRKGLDLAMDSDRLASVISTSAVGGLGVIPAVRTPSGTVERKAAVAALDDLSKWDTKGVQRINDEQETRNKQLDQIKDSPYWRGRLRGLIGQTLGPKPSVDAEVLQRFEKEYELRLYREYYWPRAYKIYEWHLYEWGDLPEEGSYILTIDVSGIPQDVLERIKELTGGRIPKQYIGEKWNLRKKVREIKHKPFRMKPPWLKGPGDWFY